jgi:hypothetical protein
VFEGRNDPAIADGFNLDFPDPGAKFPGEAKREGVSRFEDFGDHVNTVYTSFKEVKAGLPSSPPIRAES